MQAHEGEILSLTSLGPDEVLATSLDQGSSVWSHTSGTQTATLGGHAEPVHCVQRMPGGGDVVTASAGNKIGVRKSPVVTEAPFAMHKLRTDVVKGSVTAMQLLPLNGLLLLGQDNGGLTLLC